MYLNNVFLFSINICCQRKNDFLKPIQNTVFLVLNHTCIIIICQNKFLTGTSINFEQKTCGSHLDTSLRIIGGADL